jgi:MFS family permease
MDSLATSRPSIAQRRRARRLAYVNGSLWALGNGLISGTLVVALAIELGLSRDEGLWISLLKAAPHLAGMLRLGAPALVGRLGDRKAVCIGAYFLSTLPLLALPLVVVPGWLPSTEMAIAVLVALWCGYHLLEYVATVLFYAWLADIAPVRIRGRFLGRRERWMVLSQAVSMVAAALFHYAWRAAQWSPDWAVSAITAAVGTLFLIAALAPLVRMPAFTTRREASRPVSFASLIGPLVDRRFVALLALGSWFSFFNGLVQSPQEIYPYRVVGMTVASLLILRTLMRVGQYAVSPWLGRLTDRIGYRPILGICLPIVAAGTLFYQAATPDHAWWIAGAWAAWIAYAGINIALPGLMLKTSPAENRAGYVAAFYTVSGLCVAAGTIAGGYLFDAIADWQLVLADGRFTLQRYGLFFIGGWLARTLGVAILLAVAEPPTAGRSTGSRL